MDGNLAYMNVPPANWNTSGWIDDLEYVGLNGRDQFDIGSRNAHADFDTGLAAAHGGADSRNYTIQDVLTYVTGGGAHTFKTGFTWNRPMVRPQRIGANDNGTFTFRHNLPFNPANPFTYPSQFSIVMGDILVDSDDDWFNGFVQDQWRVTPNSHVESRSPLRLPAAHAGDEDGLRTAPRLRLRPDMARAGR